MRVSPFIMQSLGESCIRLQLLELSGRPSILPLAFNYCP